MKSLAAQSLMDQIDSSIKDCSSISSSHLSIESYLAKYLIVFISGIYEESIETIVNEMVDKLGNSNVSLYVKDRLNRNFQNPSYDTINDLIKKFGNPVWTTRLNALPLDAKDSINSIVQNKNAIAHGSPVILTIGDVINYHVNSKQIIATIDDMLL
jgi:hypothetical protein